MVSSIQTRSQKVQIKRDRLNLPKQTRQEGRFNPSKSTYHKVTVLNALIDNLNMQQVLEQITAFIETRLPHQVITLNAEILYQAQADQQLLQLINRADLVTPDGTGVVWASRYLGQPVQERVTGIDLLYSLVPLAAEKGWRIFFLGGVPGVAQAAGQKLKDKYPQLCVAGSCHGYFKIGSTEEQQVLKMIKEEQPDLLFVGLGAPRQEFWIREKIDQGQLTVPVCIGVGGSFDVIAGRVKRAPRWMQRCHLEWLGRLIQEPWRWRRMLALPLFVLKVLRRRIKTDTLGI